MAGEPAQQAFWHFSLALYNEPGAAPACLVLQDGHGRDVNLALWCCWAGASGRGRLGGEAIAAADLAVANWRGEVIERLRAARRAIKAAAADNPELYARAKALELEAERVEQFRLAARAPDAAERPRSERLADAEANLRGYLGAGVGEDIVAPLLAALDAVT